MKRKQIFVFLLAICGGIFLFNCNSLLFFKDKDNFFIKLWPLEFFSESKHQKWGYESFEKNLFIKYWGVTIYSKYISQVCI